MPGLNLHPSMTTETIQIAGHNGDTIDAYVAKPAGDGPFASVIVAHHMPGWGRVVHRGHAPLRTPRLPSDLPQPARPHGARHRIRDVRPYPR